MKAAAAALKELEEEKEEEEEGKAAANTEKEKNAEVKATIVAEDEMRADASEDLARAKAFAAEKIMLAKAEALKAQKEQRELEKADVEAQKLKHKAYTLSRLEKQAELNAMRDIKQAEDELARFANPAPSEDSALEEFDLKRLSAAPEHAPFLTQPQLFAVGAAEAHPSGGARTTAVKNVELIAETTGLEESLYNEDDVSQSMLKSSIQKAKAVGAAAARAQQAAREAFRVATEASAHSKEQLQNAEAAAEQDADAWSSLVKEA